MKDDEFLIGHACMCMFFAWGGRLWALLSIMAPLRVINAAQYAEHGSQDHQILTAAVYERPLILWPTATCRVDAVSLSAKSAWHFFMYDVIHVMWRFPEISRQLLVMIFATGVPQASPPLKTKVSYSQYGFLIRDYTRLQEGPLCRLLRAPS